MKLATSKRACTQTCGKDLRSGCTIQLVSAITNGPGCCTMRMRRVFIQARSKAAATRKKNSVSSKKSKADMVSAALKGPEADPEA
ncbi:spore coat protein [Serpentinimonas maccroryi]|uniref:Spore coat protein n=1 Tax=Serpentinimonas maccroryi TaxID=1458426 RepID=A0A060NP61_9BURK|nr:spore coat protein [Serpentinimonas maccroryi]